MSVSAQRWCTVEKGGEFFYVWRATCNKRASFCMWVLKVSSEGKGLWCCSCSCSPFPDLWFYSSLFSNFFLCTPTAVKIGKPERQFLAVMGPFGLFCKNQRIQSLSFVFFLHQGVCYYIISVSFLGQVTGFEHSDSFIQDYWKYWLCDDRNDRYLFHQSGFGELT